MIDMIYSKEIAHRIDSVCTIIPTMRWLIASGFDVVYDMQREMYDINIKKTRLY